MRLLPLVTAQGPLARVTDWVTALLDALPVQRATAGTIVLLATVVAIVYAGLMFVVIARMSPDYFVAREPSAASWRTRHPATRWAVRILKNLLGVLFVLAGLAMLILPGQGALTILVGVCLLDFPGKRRLELRIVSRRPVLRAINWIRRQARRPPLVLPPDAEE